MAEAFSPHALPPSKAECYDALRLEIRSVLDGETNRVARMATVASMLAAAFDSFNKAAGNTGSGAGASS